MKQLYCPHRITISGIQQYCNNGKFPVDCEHCDCPDKQELDITVTTDSVIPPKSKTDSIYVMCYGLDGTQDVCKNCTNRRGCINCNNGELKESSPVNLFKPKPKGMTREERIKQKAKEYRKYRESYGVIDPVVLDEIEDAYYDGCLCTENAMIEKACEWLETINLDYYQISEGVFSTDLVKDFRKAMEE